MCLETEFVLLGPSSGTKVVPTDKLTAFNEPIFEFNYSDLIKGLRAGFQGQGEDPGLNLRLGEYLTGSLAKKLPRSQWKLDIKFGIHTLRTSPGVDLVGSVDVRVESKLLPHLKSIMTCGSPHHQLKLKFRAMVDGIQSRLPKSPVISGNFGDVVQDQGVEIDLSPQLDGGDGQADLTQYVHFQFLPRNYNTERLELDEIHYWEISGIRLEVVITGPPCPFTDKGLPAYVTKANKNFLSGGVDGPAPGLQILVKGDVIIRCHESVLTGQSPVWRRVMEGNSITARCGVIRMSDRTAEEVKVFLSFLYHQDNGIGTEKALIDPSLTLTLLEMAHLYEVSWLVDKMKEYLLKIAVHKFSSETALRMTRFAGDPELKWKGFEALKLKT